MLTQVPVDRITRKEIKGNDPKTLRRAYRLKYGAAFVPNLIRHQYLEIDFPLLLSFHLFVGSFIAAAFYFLFTIQQFQLKINPLEVKSKIRHVLGLPFCSMA